MLRLFALAYILLIIRVLCAGELAALVPTGESNHKSA
jgi:hypothetical protein